MTDLVDSFGRVHDYLRISVTDRCNLRCAYCRPPGFVRKERAELLTFEELARLARLSVRLGVSKIRLTGGEPLVRNGLPALVAQLARIPGLATLGLTTNGVQLAAAAGELRRAGLTRSALNVSLDSLRRDRFRAITGEDRLADVQAGIEAALRQGFSPLKLNMVVIGGLNDDEVLDFAELTRDPRVTVRYVEYMPFHGTTWRRAQYRSQAKVLTALRGRYTLLPHQASGVAREFTVRETGGRVGFITALSAEFCGRCRRLRLTADGELKSCLFQPAEVSLRDLARAGATDEELAAAVQQTVRRKLRRRPPLHSLAAAPRRAMVEIGG